MQTKLQFVSSQCCFQDQTNMRIRPFGKQGNVRKSLTSFSVAVSHLSPAHCVPLAHGFWSTWSHLSYRCGPRGCWDTGQSLWRKQRSLCFKPYQHRWSTVRTQYSSWTKYSVTDTRSFTAGCSVGSNTEELSGHMRREKKKQKNTVRMSLEAAHRHTASLNRRRTRPAIFVFCNVVAKAACFSQQMSQWSSVCPRTAVWLTSVCFFFFSQND